MQSRRKTALVVEDHPEIRSGIRALFLRMGIDTIEAADAQSALSRLEACKPDVVCLDLVLPESSGYELCEFIRKSPAHHRTPILMMSDRAYPEDRAHAAEAGANAFLVKPFSEESLRRRIEALLAQP
ncbi:MAG: response regulator [Myxococcales bacterium]|nr:response regulator [Myxococcales bacterium]